MIHPTLLTHPIYRPISLLVHLLRFLQHLQTYFDKNNILCKNHFGFRDGFSTVCA